MSDRLLDLPLAALAAGLRSRAFTSVDLWHEARAAMDAGEPRLNAYKLRMDERAERAAREADAAFASGRDAGILAGIPVSVKDLYGIPGVPTFAGSARELPPEWRTAGPLVECLLEQRAVITGKTHTVEFAFGALGLNAHWPTPRNPWDATHARVPGGSSSGAGVSLCECSAIVALGSDTAGSVRVPAALTGNVGYKPTLGRWSTRGIAPLSRLFDTPGLLARTVEDAWFAAREFDAREFREDAGALRDIGPAGALRIGVPEEHAWDECGPAIAEGVRGALAELERAGHRLVAMPFPEAVEAFGQFKAGGTSGAELLAFLTHSLPEWIPLLDPNVGIRMKNSAAISEADLRRRVESLASLASRMQHRFEAIDVIAMPTTPITAPRVDEIADWETYRTVNLRMVRNTCLANLLGLNGLTLPVALDPPGLPVGLQLMAAPGRDDLLFAAGLAFERVLGIARERLGKPPMLAPY